MANKKLENGELYHFNTCPFCIKVRMAAWRLGIDIEQKNIKINAKYKDELVTGGGKKQVPCLRIDNGEAGVEWIYESNDIIEYLKAYSKA